MTVAFVTAGTITVSAGAATLSPSMPASIVAGNLLIGTCCSKNNATHTWPAGWTKGGQSNSGASFTSSWGYKVAVGGDTSPAVTWTGSVACSAQIAQYTGNGVAPISGTPNMTSNTGTTSPHATTAVTTTADNSEVLYLESAAANTSDAAPTGWTQDVNGGSATSATHHAFGHKPIPPSGTGSGATSTTGAAAAWVRWNIEVLAAVAAAPTTWASGAGDKASNITLTGSSLIATASSATAAGVRATTYKKVGKVHWEITPTASTDLAIGLANIAESLADTLGQTTNSLAYFQGGAVQINAATLATIAAWVAGNVLAFEWDIPNNLIWIAVGAGNWNNSGTANPATGVGGVSTATLAAGSWTPSLGFDISGDSGTLNVGNTAFSRTVSAGFSAWDSTGTNVNLISVSATASAGSLAPSVGIGLIGAVATTAAGAIAPAIFFPVAVPGAAVSTAAGSLATAEADTLPGAAATASAGSIGFSPSKTLPGASATAAAGAISSAASTTPTGAGAAASAGALASAVTRALAGVAATVAAGIIATALAVTPLGVSATATAGTIVVPGALVLPGVSATVHAGSVGPAISKPFSGAAVSASAGTIAPTLGAAVTGTTASTSAGLLGFSTTRALAGTASTALAGTLVAAEPATVTGAEAATGAGTFAGTRVGIPGAAALATAGDVSAETFGGLIFVRNETLRGLAAVNETLSMAATIAETMTAPAPAGESMGGPAAEGDELEAPDAEGETLQ